MRDLRVLYINPLFSFPTVSLPWQLWFAKAPYKYYLMTVVNTAVAVSVCRDALDWPRTTTKSLPKVCLSSLSRFSQPELLADPKRLLYF